eukprot:gene875-9786_t
MSETKTRVTVRTRNFMTNRLLRRKQFAVDILHPGTKSLSNKELTEKLAKMYKVENQQTIVLFGFKSHFGGGKSTGFCSIYDNVNQLKKTEPRFRLVRKGLAEKIEKSRKQTKEKKNRASKFFGKEKIAKLRGAGEKK